MYADALTALLSLALFLLVFYGPWQATCTDWGRNVIFESRDKIFDMAADGELDFDSDEYKTIRASLQTAYSISTFCYCAGCLGAYARSCRR